MDNFDTDTFVESVWPIVLIFIIVVSFCSCLCFCCSCCPWYKRRHQGIVYQNITPPANRVAITTTNNPTGYPITQHVTITPNPVVYPVQQVAYPVQQVSTVQTSVAAYQPPTVVPAMPHPIPPYGQPPPYSEVASAPSASAPSLSEAYEKPAPYNPYYGSNNH